jgi:hypothetical protein
MAKGYRLSANAIRRIGDAVHQTENEPINRVGGARQKVPGDVRWFSVRNDSDDDAPGFGVAALTDKLQINDEIVLPKIDKPSTTFYRQYVVVNPFGIKAGENGLVTIEGPVDVLFDNGDDPDVGDGWGPKPGQWKLFKGYPQTACVYYQLDDKRLRADWSPINSLIGKTDAAIAKGSSGTVSLYKGDGTTDSTVNITGVFNRFADVAISKYVAVQFINGTPFLVAAECS